MGEKKNSQETKTLCIESETTLVDEMHNDPHGRELDPLLTQF
jgi:hypothetical protein